MGAVALLGFGPLTASALASPGSVASGWWAQVPQSAVGVPAAGLFVENSPSGAVAVSAVRAEGVAGAVRLVLTVSGNAVLTQPPVACRLTSGFQPVQGGAWADRPSYDCTRPVVATLSADKTQASFDLDAGAGPDVAVAVVAGGQADRAAFEAPAVSASARPAPHVAVAVRTLPAGTASTAPPTATAPVPVPPASPATAPGASAPVVEQQQPAPTPAPVAAQSAPTPTAPVADAAPVRARGTVATYVGVAGLLLLVTYWADGFGVVAVRTAARRGASA